MKENKIFSIIGKIVVWIVGIVIAFPWIFSTICHIKFEPPEGNTYVYKLESTDIITSSYVAISFPKSNVMSIYRYEEDAFSRVSGLKVDYYLSGKSFLHIGPVFMDPEPSLLPWDNYEFHNQYTVDKASAYLEPIKIVSLNATDVDMSIKDVNIHMIIDIRTKSIKIDDNVYKLIEEDDVDLRYPIRQFDLNGKEEWSD